MRSDSPSFGMVMPNRSYSTGTYRFGFNGKENDNEVKGNANQQDYGMRIYDTRLGKFLSVDPLTKQYPQLTPYQFASNTPIQAIDLDGLEERKVIDGSVIHGPVNLTNSNAEVIKKSPQLVFDKVLTGSVSLFNNIRTLSNISNERQQTTNSEAQKPLSSSKSSSGNSVSNYSDLSDIGVAIIKTQVDKMYSVPQFGGWGKSTLKPYNMTEIRAGVAYKTGEDVVFAKSVSNGLKITSLGLVTIGTVGDFLNYQNGAISKNELQFNLGIIGASMVQPVVGLMKLSLDLSPHGNELHQHFEGIEMMKLKKEQEDAKAKEHSYKIDQKQ